MQVKIKELELQAKALELSSKEKAYAKPSHHNASAKKFAASNAGDDSFEKVKGKGPPPLRPSFKKVEIINVARYKSILCTEFQKGKCSREEQCQFAHTQIELREPDQSIEDYLVAHRARNPKLDFVYSIAHAAKMQE